MQDLVDKTLELLALYAKKDIKLPAALIGNLGKIIIYSELQKRFSNDTLQFKGGTFPGHDIILNKLRIQVKTRVNPAPKKTKNGELTFEDSPTISKSIIKDKKCDIIILIIIYTKEDYSEILDQNIYIFDKKDFRFFSAVNFRSGKSKRDYTIVNILRMTGSLTPRNQVIFDHYSTNEYPALFRNSKDNWEKISYEL
ncbi:MAG: hypothetical protein QF812_01760 [Nitrososphaerales archaeon]|jgi:hypothetical protein|nr:hypothetical protein [Nitrososphaerales archaeon]